MKGLPIRRFFFEKNAPPLRRTGKQKAIDTGYKKLIAGSDGEFAGANKIYEKTAREKQGNRAFRRALVERGQLLLAQSRQLVLPDFVSSHAGERRTIG